MRLMPMLPVQRHALEYACCFKVALSTEQFTTSLLHQGLGPSLPGVVSVVAAPAIWEAIPLHIRSGVQSPPTFKRHLKAPSLLPGLWSTLKNRPHTSVIMYVWNIVRVKIALLMVEKLPYIISYKIVQIIRGVINYSIGFPRSPLGWTLVSPAPQLKPPMAAWVQLRGHEMLLPLYSGPWWEHSQARQL